MKIRQFLIFAIFFSLVIGGLEARDFSWKGKTYRDVKIVAVTEETVTLSSRDEEITVPRKSLVGFLASDVDKFAEDQKKGLRSPVKGLEPVDQHAMERARIHGNATGIRKEGFRVFSSSSGISDIRTSKSGRVLKKQPKRGGVTIFQGTVFVKGLSAKENTSFDRTLYRDGWIKIDGQRLPAFTATKPRVTLPKLRVERKWTNDKGDHLEGTLVGVKEGKAAIQPKKGKMVIYEISKLSEEDQELIKDEVKKHEKAVEQTKKDYPWLKLK